MVDEVPHAKLSNCVLQRLPNVRQYAALQLANSFGLGPPYAECSAHRRVVVPILDMIDGPLALFAGIQK